MSAMNLFEEVVRNGVNLSLRQLAMVLHIESHPKESTIRGLAQCLNISKPAVTRGIDRLELEGLVTRVTDPKDKRSVNVFLTETGRAFTEKMRNIAQPLEMQKTHISPRQGYRHINRTPRFGESNA